MRRATVMLLAAWLMTETLLAQRVPSVPISAVSEEREMTCQTKVRYLLRQLDLTREQLRHARGLMATILDDDANPPLSIAQVRAMVAELEEAQGADDEQRVKQIEQELRELGQRYDREAEFVMNMESVLTEEQKVVLQQARERLKRNPSGALRPIDVFRVLNRLELSEEQRARFDQLHNMFRERLRETKRLDDEARFQLMNGLLELIESELTPEQQQKFEFNIRRLRSDLAFNNIRVQMPETQPAGPEPEQKDKPAGQ